MSNRFTELTALISAQEKIILSRSKALNVPVPSLTDGIDPILDADDEAAAAGLVLAAAAEELAILVSGPVKSLIVPWHSTHIAMHIIISYRLFEFVPLERGASISFADIAAKSNPKLPEVLVKRIFKHAFCRYIFAEGPKGHVVHNSVSRYLAQTKLAQQAMMMIYEEMWPAASKAVPALRKWGDFIEPNQGPSQLGHGDDLDFFQRVNLTPERSKRFADSMAWWSEHANKPEYLIGAYPWDQIPQGGTFVDIGGSHGTVDVALAEAYPHLNFVVQDMQETIEKARALVQHPRIRFEANDFWKGQPIKGADVYFFRIVLHDWSDPYVVKILKHVAAAMGPHSKIILYERVLPERGEVPNNVELEARNSDLYMLEVANGRERDLDDWNQIVSLTDKRLRITKVIRPKLAPLQVVEISMNS